MRKLCPNLDREDALDTVLEVPIPEEMFSSVGTSRATKFGCTNMKAWMRSHVDRSEPCSIGRGELQLMLGVIGAPLIPLPLKAKQSVISHHFKQDPIESSMAKYIVQQYIAASGGDGALNAVTSMCAMGMVRMTASELNGNDQNGSSGGGNNSSSSNSNSNSNANKKVSNIKAGVGGEMGGFVLWQKKPELWCLELVVSGCKISAGSDGKVAWRQTPWHQSHASRGPPRPLRRSLQGLDPMLTANLFSNSVYIGERTINGEDCFTLRVDAEAANLQARNSSSVEIIRHTVWGCFSQRTGLLVQLEDSHLLQIKSNNNQGSVYWETAMESLIEDYRTIDGINIAHAGRTTVSLVRFGDNNEGSTRTRMEETWAIEELDFNIWGLSMDCFLPPSDIKEGKEGQEMGVKGVRPAGRVQGGNRIGPSRVAAVDSEESPEDDGKS
ncbi:uncharacterized protein [Typha latifolia]|uniref:uncharacterized protein n=1 Tax=Typha latifolia TaxID=4733 RepID=UPI003C2CF737